MRISHLTTYPQVETVLSTPRTELTELQSRKTSLALSNSYESQAAVQTKEWNYLDPWEFPRYIVSSSLSVCVCLLSCAFFVLRSSLYFFVPYLFLTDSSPFL
jgi:hypothetical protein